jgi:hypothetical protein
LIVGNGLSISLHRHIGDALAGWDPSSPLGWADRRGLALDHFPRLASALAEAPPGTDFERIQDVASRFRSQTLEASEIRHFLALAYSLFDAAVVRHGRRAWSTWPWAKYLAEIGTRLRVAVSFNYDLVLEHTLEVAGVAFRRIALDQYEEHGVPVHKPHGSIDYEPSGIFAEQTWPIESIADLLDTGLERLNDVERLKPRLHPELVPPNQSSLIEGFQWVAPGFDEFARQAGGCGECWVAGHSYGIVDRAEIDRLLGTLHPGTRVVIANPTPSHDLEACIERLGLEAEVRDGPPDAPDATVANPGSDFPVADSFERGGGPPIVAMATEGPLSAVNLNIEGFPGRDLVPRKRRLQVTGPEEPGRNDPCWCGSGRKFKKCHGS